MNNRITMSHPANGIAIIDIEGTIGVPEHWQFDSEDERVATYEKFRAVVDELRAIDAHTVRVNIRSQGGSVEDALLIYEALATLPAKVETVCHGYVASAATIIAQAGDVRKISNGTLYLIHRATMVVEGNVADVMQASALLSKTDERVAQIYAERSGFDVEDFREMMSRQGGRGEWLSPEEAVAAGLADEVVNLSYLARVGKKIKELMSPKKIEQQVKNMDFQEIFVMPKQQIEAKATRTMTKEDPAINILTYKPTANQQAYNQDVAAFRSTLI